MKIKVIVVIALVLFTQTECSPCRGSIARCRPSCARSARACCTNRCKPSVVHHSMHPSHPNPHVKYRPTPRPIVPPVVLKKTPDAESEEKKLVELRKAADLHKQEQDRMKNETRKMEAWIKEQDEELEQRVKSAKTMRVHLR